MISVLDFLENAAKQYPENVAVRDDEKSYTYEEFVAKAQEIAIVLVEEYGVSLHDPVALYMEKSSDTLLLMMGILYAGGFYSVIDVRHPRQSIESILDIFSPKLVIYGGDADTDTVSELAKTFRIVSLKETMIDGKSFVGQNSRGAQIISEIKSKRTTLFPLYVNFTSGSTGVPKGVLISHGSVIDFIDEFIKIAGINSCDIIGNQAPFDFDVSVKDIYGAFAVGATIQIIPREHFSNPIALMDCLCENKVTVLIWAVSAMCFVSIMKGLEYKTPKSVRLVMFSGEVIPIKHFEKWRDHLAKARFVNLYGPTEITCNCTYYEIPPNMEFAQNDCIPIGTAFPNENVFLLDENDKLVEPGNIGKEGEICVAGECLAIGYYNDFDRTAKSFVQNPINDRFYERIYRTGDIGRYRSDGGLEYVARRDFQIKHQGHRIELGEIEVNITAVECVDRCGCIYDEEKKRIIAYYCGTADKSEVEAALKEKLPQFMIPNKLLKMDEIPISKNGKIDRNELLNIYKKRLI